jgi:hypothetical protein
MKNSRVLRALGCCTLLIAAAGATLVGCSDAAQPVEPTGPFIAFSDAFKGYHSWKSYEIDGPDVDVVHIGGKKKLFINKLPSAKTGKFPVGTVIIKEQQNEADILKRRVFAMVKRGGTFNVGGADGWEWFEVEPQGDAVDTALLKWRGVGPPSGEAYGGDKNGGCNGCHRSGATSDFTMSAPMSALVK